MKVTCWLRYSEDKGGYFHNHYVKGWDSKHLANPVAIVKGGVQEKWKDYKWAKQYRHLIDGQIV